MEDETVGWHHRLNGHEFEQALGDGEGQGSRSAAVLGVAESDTSESLTSSRGDEGCGCSVAGARSRGVLRPFPSCPS